MGLLLLDIQQSEKSQTKEIAALAMIVSKSQCKDWCKGDKVKLMNNKITCQAVMCHDITFIIKLKIKNYKKRYFAIYFLLFVFKLLILIFKLVYYYFFILSYLVKIYK